jgi:hypothetical protein
MKWSASNEPVLLSTIVAGALVAVSQALLLIDQGASLALAVGTALGALAVVVGGGAVARGHVTPWEPDTVVVRPSSLDPDDVGDPPEDITTETPDR